VNTVTSRRNALVERFRAAVRGRRHAAGTVLLDGEHVIRDAMDAGVAIVDIAIDARLTSRPAIAALVDDAGRQGTRVTFVTSAVMDALSPVRAPSGVVALAARPSSNLSHALSGTSPLASLAVALQDPGNAGAIVRAADAGGATGVVFAGASADPFGWKAIRAAMGSTFRVPVASEPDAAPVLETARHAGLRVLAAVAAGGVDLYEADLRAPLLVAIGGEGAGLPSNVVDAADARLSIPMRPHVESLNAATAAALIVYEARRQRRAS
jgi:TrmH family RNA methyltransferase